MVLLRTLALLRHSLEEFKPLPNIFGVWNIDHYESLCVWRYYETRKTLSPLSLTFVSWKHKTIKPTWEVLSYLLVRTMRNSFRKD